ncbi:MAG: family 1 glycosylhydrolase [Anaerolineaceae bacterium]|nr:family 1 glycosylhydrolase [Anaerolineaceae bacterium]MDD4043074.1 family 1 glycosylhydrolase [Anaerolineaceae bacterium]
MPRATFNFPSGFLWGTATAAHQVEGNNTNNDWWAWEQQPGHIQDDDRSGKTCDWWGGRWREDFNRAQDGWQNAHRFSVEWSRIQPEPDRWDEAALDRYRQMLLGLRERNITAMITLHHFSSPLWLAEMGGWENDTVVELFANFARRTVEALKSHCQLWVTINEPNVYAYGGYLGGGFPPGKNDQRTALKVLLNMLKAHAAAYEVIHEVQPEAQVGVAHHWRGFQPANSGLLTRNVIRLHHKVFNDAFALALTTGKFDAGMLKEDVPQAKDTQDFVGLNYYTRDLVKFDLGKSDRFFSSRYFPENAVLSETGFIASDPHGFRDAIKWADRFGLPIYVTGNGCDDSKDDFRRRYLLEHLHAMWHTLNNNTPVKGYFHWTLVDNFEWERGWNERFGLWALDPQTQIRTKRKSADLYAEICRTNAITSETVEKFAPEVYDLIYPE